MNGSTAYRVSATWGKFSQGSIALNTTGKLAPAAPGARNGVGFTFDTHMAGLGASDSVQHSTSIASVTAEIDLPADMPKDVDGTSLGIDFLGFNHVLHAFVKKDADARGCVVVNCAGTTRVIEFPYGAESGGASNSTGSVDFEQMFFSNAVLVTEGDPPKFPKIPPYAAELVILVERRKSSAEIMIQIDNLDVTAVFTSPDGPAPEPTKQGQYQ